MKKFFKIPMLILLLNSNIFAAEDMSTMSTFEERQTRMESLLNALPSGNDQLEQINYAQQAIPIEDDGFSVKESNGLEEEVPFKTR